MKYVAPVRKELGIRTVFNILGPLSNPAGANIELMGVYDESLIEPLAKVMQNLGVKRGMVVYGTDKIDEISMSSETKVCEILDKENLKSYTISPKDFGYDFCDKKELEGGSVKENAEIIRNIFNLKDNGAKRKVVCMNAGAGFYIAKKVKNIKEGVQMAENLIDEKKAFEKLEDFIKESNS